MTSFEPLQQELDQLKAQGLYRDWRRVEAIDEGRIRVDGRWLVHLASNNYLGLTMHPRVIAAAQSATAEYGTGAGSARLIGGTFELHEALERKLAEFKQAQAALLFPTGYMANLGIIPALVGPGDLVIGDHLNHASLIDACRLSRASFRVYPHRDVEWLGAALKRRAGKYRRILIVTEGLFSMDGDLAPLPEIAEMTQRYGAWLLLDDAHATGVFGPNGRGTLEHFGVSTEGVLQMGTLSKALGSLGGYLAGPRAVVELLKNRARSFIYTTAMPPGCAAAALEALRVIEQEPHWRAQLSENMNGWVTRLRQAGVDLVSDASQIVPVRVGSSEQTMALAQRLWDAGVYAPGIRPPTVPVGQARIRTSVTSRHTAADLDQAARLFGEIWSRRRIPAWA